MIETKQTHIIRHLIKFLIIGSCFTALFTITLDANATEPFKIKKANTYLPLIALTFDDGPHPRHTPKILKTLKENNIKATFFCVGQQIKKFKSIVKTINEDGHELGNHSFSHLENKKITSEQKFKEIVKSQRLFYKSTKTFPIFYRPPYGTISKYDEALFSKYFYKAILWSIDAKDWKKEITTEKIIENVTSKLTNGSIILCHDTNNRTVNAIPEIIKIAKEKGYKFVTVSELLKYHQTHTYQKDI